MIIEILKLNNLIKNMEAIYGYKCYTLGHYLIMMKFFQLSFGYKLLFEDWL